MARSVLRTVAKLLKEGYSRVFLTHLESSLRVAELNPVDYSRSGSPRLSAGTCAQPRAQSEPRERPAQQAQHRTRRSAPAAQLLGTTCGVHKGSKKECGSDWRSLQDDMLIAVAIRLPPKAAAQMRLVCKAWRRAADRGVQTLQSDVRWTDENLRCIPDKYPSVTFLDLQHGSSLLGSLAPLLRMVNLRHLRLCSLCQPPDNYQTTLSKLKQLSTLSLCSAITLRRLNLVGFTQLQRLDLTNCNKVETLGFTSLPSLTCLCMRECRSIQRWSFLARLPALQALDLAYCATVDDNTLQSLMGSQNLRVLVLLHCRLVTDDGIYQLGGNQTLQDVYLDGCAAVTDRGMKALQVAAPALNLIRISP